MISIVSGIRNALDLLDLSVLPTAIRVGRRRRIRFGFLTALLGVVRQFVVPDMKRISFCLAQALQADSSTGERCSQKT